MAPPSFLINTRAKACLCYFPLFSAIFLLLAARDLSIGYADAAVLLLFLIFFTAHCIKDAKRGESKSPDCGDLSSLKTVIRFIVGAACIALGAQLLITNSIALAQIFAVPERVIGLAVVGMGSSLPELVTTVSSLRKKEYSIGLGNILGANILNITFIPAVCALISGGDLPISMQKLHFFPRPLPSALLIDIPFMVLVIALAILPGIAKKQLYRWQGFLLLFLYLLYTFFIFLTG